jgi:hypothetical protein
MKALALTAVLLLAQSLFAQKAPSPQAGHLSPVPLLSPDGVIPDEQAGNFVFLDTATWDLVISYPENVGDPEFLQHPGPRVTRHIALDKHVDPMVYVSFIRDQNGKLRYVYSVHNTVNAKQGIRAWTLQVPQPPALLNTTVLQTDVASSARTFGAPSSWGTGSVTTRTTVGQQSPTWSTSTPQSTIAPGASLTGFSLQSEDLQPGFVRAAFSSAAVPTQLSSLDVPGPVQKQLAALDTMDFNNQTVLTLGPKFGPNDNQIAKVADFFTGFRILNRSGYLTNQSPFVQEALRILQSYLDGVAQSPPVPVDEYQGPELVITHAPNGPLETQIYEAMKLTLGVKGP